MRSTDEKVSFWILGVSVALCLGVFVAMFA